MADDIRIKDLQSTASYMESDDCLPIDGLALGNRKIPFTGLMDSEDDRLPTTDKTPRGAITEHEGDISEIKQSLVNKSKNVQGSINAYWNGLSVTIDFSGAIGTTAPTGVNTDIATLPSEVPKPSTAKYVVASGGANQNKYLVIAILTDGKIRAYNYTGGTVDYLYGSITFLR